MRLKNAVMTVALIIMVMVGFSTFTATHSNQRTAHAAASSSTIIWPVDVAGHDWYINQGYNNGNVSDHGCPTNCSQKYGLDLTLRNGSPVGQPVRSPVSGNVVTSFAADHPNSGDCLLIDFLNTGGNARTVSLCHLTLD